MIIWQCVKTLYPCSSHQNSWEMDVNNPLKMVLGIDPYPNSTGDWLSTATGADTTWLLRTIGILLG